MVQENSHGTNNPRELTGEEQALYDRQIRLWGVEAQRRLSSGRILIVGDVCSPVSQELAKNVVLAGVAKIFLCNSRPSNSSCFLGSDLTDVMQALQNMNPLVKICTTEDPLVAVPECDVVCSAGSPVAEDRVLSTSCRKHSVLFFSGRTAGFAGWVFIDLGEKYSYSETAKKGSVVGNGKPAVSPETPTTNHFSASFTSFPEALDAPWGNEPRRGEHGWHAVSCLLEFENRTRRMPGSDANDVSFMNELYAALQKEKESSRANPALVSALATSAHVSLPPVAAIVGGVWGREVVKVLSRKGTPLNNLFFFNARTSAGCLETIVKKAEQ